MVELLVLGTADWNQSIATNQHYMVRELARSNKVTFVESLGLRQPELKRRDLKRILARVARRSGSASDSRREVPPGVKIVTPTVIPRHKGVAAFINHFLLKRQLRDWIEHPGTKALWLYSPVNYQLNRIADVTIYHCVDLLGQVAGIDSSVINRAELDLAARNATAIASSKVVAKHLGDIGFDSVTYWQNVADVDVFDWTSASCLAARENAAVFAGNLSTSKVDFQLLADLLRAGVKLHLAGPVAEGGGSASHELNELIDLGATYHGMLALPELSDLYRRCKVGLVPYVRNDYTLGVSPLKTFEYLAAGLGVVSTDLPGVESSAVGVVRSTSDDHFVAAVKELVATFDDSQASARLAAAQKSSWNVRGDASRELLRTALGQRAESSGSGQDTAADVPTRRTPMTQARVALEAEQFAHVLLTRFNVRVDEIRSRPSDEWLRDRLRLFENYTVKSLSHQSVQEFEWLVFFDVDTPEFARSAVEDISRRHGNVFTPVYLNTLFSPEAVVPYLPRRRTGQTHLLTTRVDNDDAVSIDFMEQIQANTSADDLEFVNLIDGAQISEAGAYRRPYTSNPFITLVERWTDQPPRTVFVAGHDELAAVGPLRNVRTGHTMWVQVVHGKNIANEVLGLRMRSSSLRDWFVIDLPSDGPRASLIADQAASGVRIAARLARRPSRVRELWRAVRAERS